MGHKADAATHAAADYPTARLKPTCGSLDPRVDAYRRDLADIALFGTIAAQRYAVPTPYQCTAALAPLHGAPNAGSEQLSQLLYGEAFDVLEAGDEWCWGRAQRDGYVGYVPASALAQPGLAPTHWVAAVAAHGFATASIKTPAPLALFRNSLVHVTGTQGEFSALSCGRFVKTKLLRPLDAPADDPVTVALDYLGAPYLWGGRSHAGIDCSGLVQAALQACALPCPRDTDQQRGSVGVAVAETEWANLQRGDLVYFPGHVGLMLNAEQLLHANAFAMAVTVEPLDTVIARVAQTSDTPVLAVRRLPR
jgi:cell wall-associated NlpC family hydrolase